jgi:hypothetical protein
MNTKGNLALAVLAGISIGAVSVMAILDEIPSRLSNEAG